MEVLQKYFQGLTDGQADRLMALEDLYTTWNARINVISRKDMAHFLERHLLHSLSIAFWFSFRPGTSILDVGTGGGFPGIPLAIMFPEVSFTLVDSVAKKIRVVQEVKDALGLGNVTAIATRAEQMHTSFDYVVSRAVTNLPDFVGLAGNRVARRGFNDLPNGIIYLKGGDFGEELMMLKGWNHRLYDLSGRFREEFFATKKIVHLFRNP